MSMAEPASKQDLQDLAKQIDQKFDKIDQKFDKIGGRFDKIGERFDKIGERFDAMTEFMRGIETNLLTEFHRYAKGQTSRLHAIDSANFDFTTRIALIEERLLELEGRIRPKY